jgi:predicted dehydrogenase
MGTEVHNVTSSGAVLRGGLIGCGYVAQYHLEAWRQVPGAELAAVCDLRPERLEWASALAPNAKAHREAATMLEAERLDFVEICTRPESHLPLVELAARHKAHVLCQKPVAETRTELVAMIEACEAAGVRFMVHENWRYRSWYRALKGLVAAGVVGSPIRLRIAHRDTRALRPLGFADQPYLADRPRLILFEMGCHLVDTARYLLGEVRSVSATCGRFGRGHAGEDVAMLSLQFAHGALGLLDMSWCAPADSARAEWALNETVLEGTAGSLRLLTDGSFLYTGLDGQNERKEVAQPPADRVYVDGYIATQTHFIEGLRGGTAHETDGPDTLKTMDVVWAGYRSAAEGATIIL